MCTPFPLTERLALELLNDMEWSVSWSLADDVGWSLWNTLSSLLYISLLTAAVNLVINDSAVHTANTELQIIIIQKFPSHSILPKLPIKSKFVMPTNAKQILVIMEQCRLVLWLTQTELQQDQYRDWDQDWENWLTVYYEEVFTLQWESELYLYWEWDRGHTKPHLAFATRKV